MTDTKKPKLSEIVWRNAVAIKSLRSDKGTIGGEGALATSEGVQYHIPRLLDLVKRLGKALEEYGDHALNCDIGPGPCTCGWDKARELLKEREQ
jgi:hypothetical protein